MLIYFILITLSFSLDCDCERVEDCPAVCFDDYWSVQDWDDGDWEDDEWGWMGADWLDDDLDWDELDDLSDEEWEELLQEMLYFEDDDDFYDYWDSEDWDDEPHTPPQDYLEGDDDEDDYSWAVPGKDYDPEYGFIIDPADSWDDVPDDEFRSN